MDEIEQEFTAISKLCSLESIFNWEPGMCVDDYFNRMMPLLEELDPLDDCVQTFDLNEFVTYLIKCYYLFREDKYEQALRPLDECSEYLHKMESNHLYRRIPIALHHVVSSTRGTILAKMKKNKEALEEIKDIQSYDTMTNENKAGIWAIRAYVFILHGYKGISKAKVYVDKVLKFDSNCGHWFFLRSLILRKEREHEHLDNVPMLSETESMKKALALCPADPNILLHHADLLSQKASVSFKRCIEYEKTPQSMDRANTMRELANEHAENALNLYRNCSKIKEMSRKFQLQIVSGLIHLPEGFQDKELILRLSKTTLDRKRDSKYWNYITALYNIKCTKNLQEASKWLKLCHRYMFESSFELVRVKYALDSMKYDPIPDLQLLLDNFADLTERQQVLMQLISCYVFIENDVLTASKYFKDLTFLHPKELLLKHHKSFFIDTPNDIPLLDVLLDSIKMERADACRRNDKDLAERLKDVELSLLFSGYSSEMIKNPTNLRLMWLQQDPRYSELGDNVSDEEHETVVDREPEKVVNRNKQRKPAVADNFLSRRREKERLELGSGSGNHGSRSNGQDLCEIRSQGESFKSRHNERDHNIRTKDIGTEKYQSNLQENKRNVNTGALSSQSTSYNMGASTSQPSLYNKRDQNVGASTLQRELYNKRDQKTGDAASQLRSFHKHEQNMGAATSQFSSYNKRDRNVGTSLLPQNSYNRRDQNMGASTSQSNLYNRWERNVGSSLSQQSSYNRRDQNTGASTSQSSLYNRQDQFTDAPRIGRSKNRDTSNSARYIERKKYTKTRGHYEESSGSE